MNWNWLLLFFAGVFECVWTVEMKYSKGFTVIWPTIWTFVAMAASVWLLALAMKALPMAIAYAVWSAIGIVGTFFLDCLLFGEPASLGRAVCVGLIFIGIVGLQCCGSN